MTLAEPLANEWTGAASVGTVSVIPFCAAGDYFMAPTSPGDPTSVLFTAGACVLVGRLIALALASLTSLRRRRRTLRHSPQRPYLRYSFAPAFPS